MLPWSEDSPIHSPRSVDYNKVMIMLPLALLTSHRPSDERIRRVITRIAGMLTLEGRGTDFFM